MRERQEELRERDIRVAVITFDNPVACLSYREDTGNDWPLLMDETRQLYQAYGMMRASFRDVWGPASWIAYAREILRGRWPRPAGADVWQRGGDVLIDPRGRVRLHHVGRGPADRPAVDRILTLAGKA